MGDENSEESVVSEPSNKVRLKNAISRILGRFSRKKESLLPSEVPAENDFGGSPEIHVNINNNIKSPNIDETHSKLEEKVGVIDDNVNEIQNVQVENNDLFENILNEQTVSREVIANQADNLKMFEEDIQNLKETIPKAVEEPTGPVLGSSENPINFIAQGSSEVFSQAYSRSSNPLVTAESGEANAQEVSKTEDVDSAVVDAGSDVDPSVVAGLSQNVDSTEQDVESSFQDIHENESEIKAEETELEKVSMLDEKISGAPESDEPVEEQKAEEDEEETPEEPKEPEKEVGKSEGEDDDDEDLKENEDHVEKDAEELVETEKDKIELTEEQLKEREKEAEELVENEREKDAAEKDAAEKDAAEKDAAEKDAAEKLEKEKLNSSGDTGAGLLYPEDNRIPETDETIGSEEISDLDDSSESNTQNSAFFVGGALGAAKAKVSNSDYTNKLRSVMSPKKSSWEIIKSILKWSFILGIVALIVIFLLPILSYFWSSNMDSDKSTLATHDAKQVGGSAIDSFIDSFTSSLLWFSDPEQAELEKQQKDSVIQVGSSSALEFKGISAYPSAVYPGGLVDIQFEVKNDGVSIANEVMVYAKGSEDFVTLGGSIGRGGGLGGSSSASAEESVGSLLPGEPRLYSLLVTAPKCSSKAFDIDAHVIYHYDTSGTNDITVMDGTLYDEQVKQGKMKWFDGRSLTSAGPFTLSTWTSKKQPIPVISRYEPRDSFRVSFGIYNQKDGEAELAILKIYLPEVLVPAGCYDAVTKTLYSPDDSRCANYYETDDCQLPQPEKDEAGWYVYKIDYDAAVKKLIGTPEYTFESEKRILAPNQLKMYGCTFFYDTLKAPVTTQKTVFMRSNVFYKYDTKKSVSFTTTKTDSVPKCSSLASGELDVGTEVIGDIETIRNSVSKAICLCQSEYGGDNPEGTGIFDTKTTNLPCTSFKIDLDGCNASDVNSKSIVGNDDLFKISSDSKSFWSSSCLVDEGHLQWFDGGDSDDTYKYTDDFTSGSEPYILYEDMDYTVTVEYYAEDVSIVDWVRDVVPLLDAGFAGEWAVRVKIDSEPDDACYKSLNEPCTEDNQCGKCDDVGVCGNYLGGEKLTCISPKASTKEICMYESCTFEKVVDDTCTTDCQCISNKCSMGVCVGNSLVITSVKNSSVNNLTGAVIEINYSSSFKVNLTNGNYWLLIKPAAGAIEEEIILTDVDAESNKMKLVDLAILFDKAPEQIEGPISITLSGFDNESVEHKDTVSILYDMKPPHVVENLNVENTEKGGEVYLYWTPNEDDSDINYYTISLDGVIYMDHVRNTIHYLTDLKNGIEYEVSVMSVDLAGNVGPVAMRKVTPSDKVPPTIKSISVSPSRVYTSTDMSKISLFVIPSENLSSMTAKVIQKEIESDVVNCVALKDSSGVVLSQYYGFNCSLVTAGVPILTTVPGIVYISVNATDFSGNSAIYEGQTFTIYDY
ncbi:MAG: hypothetical protein K0B02_00360 [DPANN group archaeon]|nr:hypothetical protein [DPANN group archaeon]